MKRKIVVPFGLVLLVIVATIASAARAAIYVMNPLAKNDQAWGICLFAAIFVGSIVANVIAKAWPETEADDTNPGRSGFWGGLSIEISGDFGSDGGGDGGGE